MLCVIAKLDCVSTDVLQNLQRRAVANGAPSKKIRGHITLVTYLGDDEAGFICQCKKKLKGFPGFFVEYRRLALLSATSIITAEPEKSGNLLELYQALASVNTDALNVWTRPEYWQPHTTLVYAPDLNLTELLKPMEAVFTPFAAEVTRVEFSRVLKDGYEIVDYVDL